MLTQTTIGEITEITEDEKMMLMQAHSHLFTAKWRNSDEWAVTSLFIFGQHAIPCLVEHGLLERRSVPTDQIRITEAGCAALGKEMPTGPLTVRQDENDADVIGVVRKAYKAMVADKENVRGDGTRLASGLGGMDAVMKAVAARMIVSNASITDKYAQRTNKAMKRRYRLTEKGIEFYNKLEGQNANSGTD